MKITAVETFILHVPIPRFVADSFNTAITWGLPGVLIRTDEGITGTGYTSTLRTATPRSRRSSIEITSRS